MAERLACIVAPHFVAGIVTDGVVRTAAPIVAYMIGWSDDRVRQYVASKRWRISVVPTLANPDPPHE